ncbi:hypothetical protein GCM10010924_51590 [Rhizobium wenxiniae]|uniref:Uncharacterized protein n=1 Tax=Rhizobium wenxiniae TaxID=1737357 RepID=A0A7W9YBW9_9HYPH|nr:hypothetical protein [Rhizobium wenxiniae]MBB6165739.1 hypothetical protein [Rhizobium wenxiniae]GGG16266.1 hypothetical protein GCM10010924_51590 [Rhizobium wenxiniae]
MYDYQPIVEDHVRPNPLLQEGQRIPLEKEIVIHTNVQMSERVPTAVAV